MDENLCTRTIGHVRESEQKLHGGSVLLLPTCMRLSAGCWLFTAAPMDLAGFKLPGRSVFVPISALSLIFSTIYSSSSRPGMVEVDPLVLFSSYPTPTSVVIAVA